MPSKKKKYNARFPHARIKKIMQQDEEVGKVAAAVPVIISKSLELFIDALMSETSKTTIGRNAKTLTASHIKQTIESVKQFDFLKDLVANIKDVADNEGAEEEASNSGEGTSVSTKRPPSTNKSHNSGAKKGPGRPKKMKLDDKRSTESDISEEETEDESTEDEIETKIGTPAGFSQPMFPNTTTLPPTSIEQSMSADTESTPMSSFPPSTSANTLSEPNISEVKPMFVDTKMDAAGSIAQRQPSASPPGTPYTQYKPLEAYIQNNSGPTMLSPQSKHNKTLNVTSVGGLEVQHGNAEGPPFQGVSGGKVSDTLLPGSILPKEEIYGQNREHSPMDLDVSRPPESTIAPGIDLSVKLKHETPEVSNTNMHSQEHSIKNETEASDQNQGAGIPPPLIPDPKQVNNATQLPNPPPLVKHRDSSEIQGTTQPGLEMLKKRFGQVPYSDSNSSDKFDPEKHGSTQDSPINMTIRGSSYAKPSQPSASLGGFSVASLIGTPNISKSSSPPRLDPKPHNNIQGESRVQGSPCRDMDKNLPTAGISKPSHNPMMNSVHIFSEANRDVHHHTAPPRDDRVPPRDDRVPPRDIYPSILPPRPAHSGSPMRSDPRELLYLPRDAPQERKLPGLPRPAHSGSPMSSRDGNPDIKHPALCHPRPAHSGSPTLDPRDRLLHMSEQGRRHSEAFLSRELPKDRHFPHNEPPHERNRESPKEKSFIPRELHTRDSHQERGVPPREQAHPYSAQERGFLTQERRHSDADISRMGHVGNHMQAPLAGRPSNPKSPGEEVKNGETSGDKEKPLPKMSLAEAQAIADERIAQMMPGAFGFGGLPMMMTRPGMPYPMGLSPQMPMLPYMGLPGLNPYGIPGMPPVSHPGLFPGMPAGMFSPSSHLTQPRHPYDSLDSPKK
ncbi:unnamed protein product [Owenia fusiformis]|uniref:Dr1-associated corepressor n=1 Tax=Owenia fusiformis TaxID=6347 RepID=A0A8J1U3I1_OWEFU|nr:unnamed protein product [Owenia fusiformis]